MQHNSIGKVNIMLKKILFDLDGTLTNPKTGITKSVQYALAHFGIEEEADNLTQFIGPPLIDSFMNFYGFSLEQAREGVTAYREYFAPKGIFENDVYPGVPEMLAALKEKGAILAVASSKPELFVEQILEHFDLAKYFDVVVGSLLNETRTSKEEVLEEALRQLGVMSTNNGSQDDYTKDDNEVVVTMEEYKKATIAMVGDRKFDIIGAKAHGLTAVGVSFGFAEPGELEAEEPDFIAETVEQLKDYLLS